MKIETVTAIGLRLAGLLVLAWVMVGVIVARAVIRLSRQRSDVEHQDITRIKPDAIDLDSAELENVARMWGLTPKWWHTDNRLRRMLADAMRYKIERATWTDDGKETSESYVRMFPGA